MIFIFMLKHRVYKLRPKPKEHGASNKNCVIHAVVHCIMEKHRETWWLGAFFSPFPYSVSTLVGTPKLRYGKNHIVVVANNRHFC
jgi:hypothetical protein